MPGWDCRSTGEQAYADEILERCLYALEMAWHPWFNPAGGNCRLDFEVEANRPLFTALFRYMQVSPCSSQNLVGQRRVSSSFIELCSHFVCQAASCQEQGDRGNQLCNKNPKIARLA